MAKVTLQAALTTIISLLCNTKEMLTDAEGVARDGGLSDVVASVQYLNETVTDVLNDCRDRLAVMNGGRA